MSSYSMSLYMLGVLRINPFDDSVDVLNGTNGPLPEGRWKWHGGKKVTMEGVNLLICFRN